MEQTAYESGLTMDTITHLANLYGSRYHRILDLVKNDAQGGQNLCPHSPDIIAQIWYSIDEGASTITDFLLRRSTVGMRSAAPGGALPYVSSPWPGIQGKGRA